MRVNKEAVIQAASDIADADGLNGVSLKAVAERLEIRTPSLYNHIASLDDLLRDVAHAGMRSMNERMVQAALGVSGESAIKAVGSAYFSYVIERPGVYETIQWANWHGNGETAALFGAYRALVSRLVARLKAKPKKKEALANLLMALFHGYSSLNVGKALSAPEKAIAEFTDALNIALSGTANPP